MIKLLKAHFLLSSNCHYFTVQSSSANLLLMLSEAAGRVGDERRSNRDIAHCVSCAWYGCPWASKISFPLSQCDVNAFCAPGQERNIIFGNTAM